MGLRPLLLGAILGAAVVAGVWAFSSGGEAPAGGGRAILSLEPGPRSLERHARPAFEEAVDVINRELVLPADLRLRVVGAATARRLRIQGPEYHPGDRTLYVPWAYVRAAHEDLDHGSSAPQVAAPPHRVLVYAIEFIVYHELAHGLIDLLDLPIVGKEENAADSLAATLAFASGRLGATVVLAGGDLFEAEAERRPESLDLTSSQFYDLNRQRYDQMLCWAYGSDPSYHASFLGGVRGLPASADEVCRFEYKRQLRSWRRLLGDRLRGSRLAPLPPHGDAVARITRDPANARTNLTVGSKGFTEQRVLAEVYAQGLRAAGFRVRTRLGLGGDRAALAALRRGDVDAYPAYTGSSLDVLFGVAPKAIPRRPGAAYRAARAEFRSRGFEALPPAPLVSSNAVALGRRTANRLGITRISQLRGRARRLTLSGSPECPRRSDCLRGLREVYGLRFKRFLAVPIARRDEVLTSGLADLSIVFTTDPKIHRADLVLLRDDRRMMPPNQPTLVLRRPDASARLAKVVGALQSQLTTEVLQELDARVEIDGDSPARAALEFLEESGLL